MKIYLLTIILFIAVVNSTGQSRTLYGTVFFTNNAPDNRAEFPIELFTRDGKTLVRYAKPNADGSFSFTDLVAGRYLLKLTWTPDICLLRYRVDLRRRSKTMSTILMDVDCRNGRRPPLRNLPD